MTQGSCAKPAGVAGDGFTDDTAAIQAALGKGGQVCLPKTASFYLVSAALWIGSNTTLVLEGTLKLKPYRTTPAQALGPYAVDGGTAWKWTANQFGILQIQPGSSSVVITGSGVIDGNASIEDAGNLQYRPSDGVASHCCWGGVVAGGPDLGDYQSGISNVLIEGITIQHIQAWPISIDGANGVTLRNLTIFDAGNATQFAHGTTNAHADNLRISHVNDQGFSFYNGVSSSSLTNSTVTDALGGGITVFSDFAAGYVDHVSALVNHDILIQNDVSSGNNAHRDGQSGGTGIAVLNGFWDFSSGDNIFYDVGLRRPYNVTIDQNQIFDNSYGGVILRPCDNCSISSNSIHNDGDSTYDYTAGIWLEAADSVTVSGNRIADEGSGLAGRATGKTRIGAFGIAIQTIGNSQGQVFSPSDVDIVLTGNTISQASSSTMLQAFAGYPQHSVAVAGNVVEGMPANDFAVPSHPYP